MPVTAHADRLCNLPLRKAVHLAKRECFTAFGGQVRDQPRNLVRFLVSGDSLAI